MDVTARAPDFWHLVARDALFGRNGVQVLGRPDFAVSEYSTLKAIVPDLRALVFKEINGVFSEFWK
jgi:hypothetical protein